MSGSRWFEVIVVASKTIVIEMLEEESDIKERAAQEACDEAFSCDYVEAQSIKEITDENKLAIAKRNADEVLPLPKPKEE